MKLNIVKNTSRNVLFSTIKKFYSVAISFIMRTLMIYTLGIEYAGLNGIFTSLLNVLNLAELGVGSAIIYSMYKPIAEDDHDKICSLLQTYKQCYRLIGLVILGLGLLCMPFLDLLIEGNIPEKLNIHILFLLNLLKTVSSYWLFSYKSSLFSAFQRNDIASRITMVVTTIQCLSQIAVLLWVKNYYIYIMIGLGATILNNLFVQIVTQKIYPHYTPRGDLSKEEKRNLYQHVKDLFLSKVGGVVVNSVDTLVISAFLGITTLGFYQNYFFIFKSVSRFTTTLYISCTAGLGNKLAREGSDKIYKNFENMSFWVIWICCICSSCFLGLYQPFISAWVGDDMLLGYGIVILICIYFYIFQMMALCGVYEDAAGIWHYDRFRPLLEAVINLVLNLIMVQYIGLYGILLSTIISMACFSLPWLYRNLFKQIFRRSKKPYLTMMLKSVLWAIIANVIIGLLCQSEINTIAGFFMRAIVCVLVPGTFVFVLYGRTEHFQWLKGILLRL